MIDFILLVFIGISISVFGISYIFGILDELTKIEYAIQFRFFETAIEDSKKLRFIPRQIALLYIYFSRLAYCSGIWTIKSLEFLIFEK